MYPELEHMVANYLDVSVGYSEEDAIENIRKVLKTNVILRKACRDQLTRALEDTSFSWKKLFDKYEAFEAESEADARSYAREILWAAIFGK